MNYQLSQIPSKKASVKRRSKKESIKRRSKKASVKRRSKKASVKRRSKKASVKRRSKSVKRRSKSVKRRSKKASVKRRSKSVKRRSKKASIKRHSKKGFLKRVSFKQKGGINFASLASLASKATKFISKSPLAKQIANDVVSQGKKIAIDKANDNINKAAQQLSNKTGVKVDTDILKNVVAKKVNSSWF